MEALQIIGDNLKPIAETAKAFGYKCKLTHIEEDAKSEHKAVAGTCELCPYFIKMNEDNHATWGRCMRYGMAARGETEKMCSIGKAMSKEIKVVKDGK